MSLLDEQDAWSQLFRPWASARWFEAATLPPLAPGSRAFSPIDGWWLAELSRLSYRDDGRDVGMRAGGLREVGFVSEKGTQCVVAVPDLPEPAVALCAFRGTDEPRDWRSNFLAVPVDWPEGGRVHRGFRDAFEVAWPAVAAILDRLALPVLFGGHSLGGALAFLAASRLARPACCYAFGAPRVGDREFAVTLDRVPAFAVVHGRDVVPGLPLSSPLLRFWSAGLAVSLAPVIERGDPRDPPAPLADHAPVRYVEALRRLL